MKIPVLGFLVLALVYGGLKVGDAITATEPGDHVLILDGSMSFVDEIDGCPEALRPAIETATEDLARLKIASFARHALGRPWAYDVDYGEDHDDQDVEVGDTDDWKAARADEAVKAAATAAAEPPRYGSALLEQLERVARAFADREKGSLDITICSDGEIIEGDIDVREPFNQAQAIRDWLPRLRPGLDGATVTMVGFGRRMPVEDIRRAHEFITSLLERAGAARVELDQGTIGVAVYGGAYDEGP